MTINLGCELHPKYALKPIDSLPAFSKSCESKALWEYVGRAMKVAVLLNLGNLCFLSLEGRSIQNSPLVSYVLVSMSQIVSVAWDCLPVFVLIVRRLERVSTRNLC